MNGVHDMGGMHGFGAVIADKDEPVFHHRWEGRVRALMAMTVFRYYNLDEFRHAIEKMPADRYLRAGYYEKWLHAVESLLLEKGVITAAELLGQVPPSTVKVVTLERAPRPALVARFKPGDLVVTRTMHPRGHTRLARYARGKRGVIRTVNGPFLLPDTNAHATGRDWEACYAVEFTARELWGEDAEPQTEATDRMCIDLWESYLEPEEGE